MRPAAFPAPGPAEPILVALGVGSNLGDRRAALHTAVAELARFSTFVRGSSVWATAPRDVEDQPEFLNAVLLVRPAAPLSPGAFLKRCLAIELRMGRVRDLARGPRVIDIDLLLWGDACFREPGITVPHPRLHLRRFVLAPLAEIAPDLVVPGTGRTCADLLASCGDPGAVRKLDPLPLATA